MLRTVLATEYVTPLREGGSLPAIVEADDDGTYVLKFRAAGQGVRALVAELIAGELIRAAGLRVPEIVFATVDPRLGKTEPDAEIQDLLRKSEGLNLALDYLPGAISFDPLIDAAVVDPRLAARVVWLDALLTNVDRTARNTNLLVWHRQLWLIDHGAALYFHHAWSDPVASSRSPFAQVAQHVLLPLAADPEEVDAELCARLLAPGVLDDVLAQVPAAWLGDEPRFADVEAHRAAYRDFLLRRLEAPRVWVEEAARARAVLV
jgi:hypothetical protein